MTDKKSSKKKIIWISVIGVLLVLVILGLIFWRSLFFAVAPEEYTAKLVADTVSELLDEAETAEKNVLGFNLTMQKDFTADISVETKDETALNLTVSKDTKNKQLLADGNLEWDGNVYQSQMFVDDKYLGATTPWSDGTYLVAPSKNIGQEVLGSYGAVGLAAKLFLSKAQKEKLQDLDLSYTKIQGKPSGDEKANEKLKDTLTEEILELLEKCEIDGRNGVDYKIDGEVVGAEQITVKINPEDLFESVFALSDALNEDEKMRACLDNTTAGMLKSIVEMAEHAKTMGDIKSITIELIEYDDKVVQCTWKAKKSDGTQSKIAIGFTQSEHLLNGVKVSLDNRELVFKSNWVNNTRKISIDLEINDEAGREKTKILFDFDSEKWSIETADGKAEGKCQKNGQKGILFEMLAENNDKDIGFVLELKPKAELTSDRNEADYDNILEWSKSDIQSFLFNVGRSAI